VPRRVSLAASRNAFPRRTALQLSVLALALVALLPSASAGASPTSASPIIVPGSAEALSDAALQELLSGVPLGSGASAVPLSTLDAPALAKLLAALPQISTLSTLSNLGTPLGLGGLETSLRHATEKAVGAGDTLGQLLSGGGLSPGLVESLTTALGTPVEPLVKVLFAGKTVEQVVAEGLAATSVTALTGALLAEAEAQVEPAHLAEALVKSFNPTTVHTTTGSLPSGAPVQSLTLQELAAQLSLTPKALAEQLGQATTTLPASTPVTLSTLENGQQLALLRGTDGLVGGVLTPLEEVIEPVKEKLQETIEPIKEKVEGVVSGGSDGGGGTTTVTNVAGSTGPTTVVLNPAAASPAASSPTTAAIGRIKLISRRVKGAVATLVLWVPSPGRLKVVGSGMRSVWRNLVRSQRVTVRVSLTKARVARLRRRRHRSVKVALRASFAPSAGPRSSVATRVTLR
jgi:hypothetical protein